MSRWPATAGLLCFALAFCGQSPPPRREKVETVFFGDLKHPERALRGFYPGAAEWRWTERKFAFLIDPPPDPGPVSILLDFTLPIEVMPPGRKAVITARVNGREAGHRVFDKSGRTTLSLPVPPGTPQNSPAEVEFEVDRTFLFEGRQVGLIAVSASLVHLDRTPEVLAERTAIARQAYREHIARRKLPMPAAQEEEMMRLFHKLPISMNLWFQNQRVIKNPIDLWECQRIVDEVRPDFIIETGTYLGGSALFWANTLNGLGLTQSRVLTIDIMDFCRGAAAQKLWRRYVEFFLSSSTDPKLAATLAARVAGKKVLVSLDSNHETHHVLNELAIYAPMVSRGSYIIVEDSHIDGVPNYPEQGPGPMAAIAIFLKDGGAKDFDQDLTRERLGSTYYPGGWLRRK
jgi:cephalosporin hydroxylase